MGMIEIITMRKETKMIKATKKETGMIKTMQ